MLLNFKISDKMFLTESFHMHFIKEQDILLIFCLMTQPGEFRADRSRRSCGSPNMDYVYMHTNIPSLIRVV